MKNPSSLSCQDLIEFLWAYESGALEQEERAVFNRHLEACADCVDYLNTYRQTAHLARSAAQWGAAPGEVPEQLIQAILAAKKS